MIDPPPAYVLAGGRSSRFGSDKARAEVAGEPLVARIARLLGPHAAGVTIVADRSGKYDDLGLRTIADRTPGCGPLGGLDAAIADRIEPGGASSPWLLLASCDLVEVRAAWIASLRQAADASRRIVVFEGDRWHPMPGLYHVELADDIARRLRSEQLALRDLIESVPHRAVPLPRDWPAIAQVNTPDDLEGVRKALGEGT